MPPMFYIRMISGKCGTGAYTSYWTGTGWDADASKAKLYMKEWHAKVAVNKFQVMRGYAPHQITIVKAA
jgi:hypothetical protein